MRGSGVDNRSTPLLDQQMDRGLLLTVLDAVHGADAVAVIDDAFRRIHPGIIESALE